MSSYSYSELRPLRQKSSEQYKPDEQQIRQYAEYIGIRLPEEQFLLPLAFQGITSHLPQQWEACSTPDGEMIYRNTITKKIQQEHPLDEHYQQLVKKQRAKFLQIARMINNQSSNQLDNFQEQSEDGQLLTIPQEKSQDHSLENQNSLEKMEVPSQQLFNSYSNPLQPQSATQLLNNGMYMLSSGAFSQQFTSKQLFFNNSHNQFSIDNLQRNQKSKNLDPPILPSQQNHKNLKISQQKLINKSSNNSKQNSQFQEQKQKALYLEQLKKQVQNIKAMRIVKQQLLNQIKENNKMKSDRIKKSLMKKK